uniref:Uncharacterized protein n=1 Tax=Rhizophora mucronata TaxID=61149 RepID=A0A2P2PIV0_RHIMU
MCCASLCLLGMHCATHFHFYCSCFCVVACHS